MESLGCLTDPADKGGGHGRRPGLTKKLLQEARGAGGGLSWGTGNVGGKATT